MQETEMKSLCEELLQIAESQDDKEFHYCLNFILAGKDLEKSLDMVSKSCVLHTVTQSGRHDYAKSLLEHGVDPNVIDEDGNTPLHLAISGFHDVIINLLMEHNADVTRRNVSGMTPLDIACYMGMQSTVETFLGQTELHAREKHRDTYKLGYTALIQAVEGGNPHIVKTLLANGINVNANLDAEIGTALHVACERRILDIVDILLEACADVEALRTCHLQTPLMRAAEYGDVTICERLLAAGADIDRQTDECSTALIIACHFGQTEVFKYLLEKGANPHLRNHWGFTALYMGSDTPEIARALVNKGVEIDEICGERGEAAIHLACVVGHTETVNMLLEHNSNIDILTWHDETLLWLAIWKGFMELSLHLVNLNCDLDTPSRGFQVFLWYYTPLELALGYSYFEFAKLLILAGCKWTNPVYFKDEGDGLQPGCLPEAPWFRLREEILRYREIQISSAQDMHSWLVERLTNPFQLKELCRIIIRRNMRKSLPLLKDIERLPLPSMLKNYLQFSEFNDTIKDTCDSVD